MKLHSYSLVVATLLVGSLGACGGSAASDNGNGNTTPPPATTDTDDAGSTDPVDAAPPPPPVDHGAPSDTYPAFKPDVPQLKDNGGGAIKSPKIVTVTWPGDTSADSYEAFGDAIGATQYWKAVTGEYGVGAATSGAANHIRMTSPPKDKLNDEDVDAIVAANATGKTVSGFDPDATTWPAPDASTIYVLYIPQSANFQIHQDDGSLVDVCSSGIGGYHTAAQDTITYAVVPSCASQAGDSALDETTLSASHEIAEATLDPLPPQGYFGVDDDHYAWNVANAFQSENGDLCEFKRDAYFRSTETGFPYALQRQWSNASIAAGHSPCVPSSSVYFNVTPFDLDTISIKNEFGRNITSKGVKLAVGETKKITVGLYSDAKLDPWTLSVREGNPLTQQLGLPQTSNLTLAIDKTSGQNGEKAVVSVTLNKAPATSAGTPPTYFMVVSKSGNKSNGLPIAVSTK